MELNSNEARIPKALPVEITFAHSAQCGLLSYDIFARCGAVSRGWRDAVDAALRMFVHSTGLVTHRKHRLLRAACCTLRAAGCWPLPVPLCAAFCGLHATYCPQFVAYFLAPCCLPPAACAKILSAVRGRCPELVITRRALPTLEG